MNTIADQSIQSSPCAEEPKISEAYTHLFDETAACLGNTLAERIRFCLQDKFILHKNAKVALAALKDVFNRPKNVVRPACLGVIGGSNEGKSAVANRCHEDLGGPAAHIHSTCDEIPVVVVDMPPRSTEPRVCLAIARALGLGAFGSAIKSRMITDNVIRALSAKRARVLMLNEFQHVQPIPRSERQVVYDLIKDISNRGISLVAIGTEEAKTCLAEDEQIANRMRIVRLSSFANDQELRNFLHSLEHYYPLPKPSGLGSASFANEIYARTNGITGEVVSLCNAAAVYALRNELPCIDMNVMKKTIVLPAANAA